MKNLNLNACLLMLLFVSLSFSQRVDFEEYDLSNGLHVILHQDKSVPIVTTSVLYHVGSKDEDPERTGFAHFFEHLLFEGTKNIEKGKWFSCVCRSFSIHRYTVRRHIQTAPSATKKTTKKGRPNDSSALGRCP